MPMPLLLALTVRRELSTRPAQSLCSFRMLWESIEGFADIAAVTTPAIKKAQFVRYGLGLKALRALG